MLHSRISGTQIARRGPRPNFSFMSAVARSSSQRLSAEPAAKRNSPPERLRVSLRPDCLTADLLTVGPTACSASARGRALVGGEEMLVAIPMQDWGALRPLLVSMIFAGSGASTRELPGIVPRMTHRPRG